MIADRAVTERGNDRSSERHVSNPLRAGRHVNSGLAIAMTKEQQPPRGDTAATQRKIQEALQLQNRGQLDRAAELYLSVLNSDPDSVPALHMLGILRFQQQRLDESIAYLQGALRVEGKNAVAWCNLGTALERAGRLSEALEAQNRALALKPNYPEALNNRANVLIALDRPADALTDIKQALKLSPDIPELHFTCAIALKALGQLHSALAAFDVAIRLRPTYAEAHANRGALLLTLGRAADALASCDRALALRATFTEAMVNRGNALRELRRPQDALASYDKALGLRPDFSEAWNNRGNALLDLNRVEDACASYRRAAELRPNYPHALTQFVHQCDQIFAWRDAEEARSTLMACALDDAFDGPPFPFLSLSDDPALQHAVAASFVKSKSWSISDRTQAYKSPTSDKLPIAYLSSDFGDHPVSYLIAELIERHDRERFEVIGISTGPDKGGEMRLRLKGAFDTWVDAETMSHDQIDARIRALQTGIVVDLGGHTMHSRHFALARRPAPVQISYLGYVATTASPWIDYAIADEFVVPEAEAMHFAEKLVYMPDCFQCADTKRPRDASPSRNELGLPADGVVLCCFNATYKINKGIFDSWIRVLAAVPESSLWLLGSSATARQNFCAEAERHGINSARLCFADRVPYQEHLARLAAADLFLDTWPYNAGTTGSDALWAGLPVLTRSGRSFASRMGGSLLRAVGLPELVTNSEADYQALAIELASQPERLRQLKAKLRTSVASSALFDVKRFANHIERAYLHMWNRYKRGEPPKTFRVAELE
jgi:predicted O-linked N-acetylglucosamine transferase (SPINDLY family)